MANAVYPKWKQSCMTEADANKSLDQTGANAPFASLITTSAGYTYSAAHQFFSSLTNIVGTDVAITTPTVLNGLFDGDDSTFVTVSGTTVGAIVIYRKNAGANTTWRLVLYEDTSVTGLPVVPNGGNIVITWNAAGIFQLSDIRMKADIKKLTELGPIALYSYRYKGDSQRHVGFMAHEVAEVMPRAVGPVGEYWGVDYGHVMSELAA